MGFRELENEETKTPFLVPLNSKSEVGRLHLLLSSLAVLKFLFLSEGHLRIEKRKKERHLAREKNTAPPSIQNPVPSSLVWLVGANADAVHTSPPLRGVSFRDCYIPLPTKVKYHCSLWPRKGLRRQKAIPALRKEKSKGIMIVWV